IEPGIPRVTLRAHVRHQLEAAGLVTEGNAARPLDALPDGADPAQIYESVIAPSVARCDRWGVKEVNGDWILASADMLQPRHILILVRDFEESAASLYRKNKHEGEPKSRDWLIERFRSSLEALATLLNSPEAPTRRVWYHKLVTSQQERDDLAAWLSWPLDGKPTQHFDLYNRTHETEAHAGRVSPASIGRYTPGTDADLDAFVANMMRATADLRAITHADRPD
ncbi:MAG: hypothetical protein AAFR96_12805, partial [Planctomycetota bacterium]